MPSRQGLTRSDDDDQTRLQRVAAGFRRMDRIPDDPNSIDGGYLRDLGDVARTSNPTTQHPRSRNPLDPDALDPDALDPGALDPDPLDPDLLHPDPLDAGRPHSQPIGAGVDGSDFAVEELTPDGAGIPRADGSLAGMLRGTAILWGIIALAGFVGAVSLAKPTGTSIVDPILTALFAAALALAGSRAGTWPLLALAAAAVLLVGPSWFLIPAAVAVWIAATRPMGQAGHRAVGASAAALSALAVLNAGPFWFFGFPTLVIGMLSGWVFASAWRRSKPAERRAAKKVLLPLAIATVVVSVVTAVGGIIAGLSLLEGERNARAGLDGVQNAQADSARDSLTTARTNFTNAGNTAGSWWMKPGRLLPVVSQHLEVVESAAVAGTGTATAAEELLSTYDALNATAGQIDVTRLATLREPVANAGDVVAASATRLDESNSGWVVAPIRSQTTDLLAELTDAQATLDLGGRILEVAPGLLGADGPRRYFLIFGQPSEARELGGFMGNWGELIIDNGRFSFPRNGRTIDLLPLNENNPEVAPAEPYEFSFDLPASVRAYYEPSRNVQDVTGSPDFPTVAAMMADIYPQADGSPIDGAIYVDPFSLQALLQLTGPIVIDNGALTLDAATAGMFLAREQYRGLDNREQRTDLLSDAFATTFERLTAADLPAPQNLVNTLGPMVEAGRLQFTSFTPEEAVVLAELGLNGGVDPLADADFLSVSSANAANNKIDSFLQRRIRYSPTFEPTTGNVTATVSIELENAAPREGFSEEVIGIGDMLGVSRQLVTVRTPLEAVATRIDGVAAESPADRREEFGLQSFGVFVTMGPGETRTIELDLEGQIGPSDTYQVRLDNQPLVNFDELTVDVNAADGWSTQDADPGATDQKMIWDRDIDLSTKFGQ